MDVTSLTKLRQQESIVFEIDGISLKVQKSWIVEGENRLSYTTIVRLIECCREYHWERDVLAFLKNGHLDSICKTINCVFNKPILAESQIFIKYTVFNICQKSYTLKFQVLNEERKILYAESFIVSVFFDPVTEKSILPPEEIRKKLFTIYNSKLSENGKTIH